MNCGRTLGASVTNASTCVFDSHTLAGRDASLCDFGESLCGKSTVAVGEVERSSLAHRRGGITGSVSVSTEIKESGRGTIGTGSINNCIGISV